MNKWCNMQKNGGNSRGIDYFLYIFRYVWKRWKKQKVGEYVMRKIRKRTFAELVMENKRQLLNDVSALEKLEEKMETRWLHKPE